MEFLLSAMQANDAKLCIFRKEIPSIKKTIVKLWVNCGAWGLIF
jgi:hypothetical protein